jgi:ribokinase
LAGIVVVGSLNMDLVVRCGRIPAPGETVLGSGFQMLPGGKGANQAYAAARLSRGRVSMIGRVGEDAFGLALRENLMRVGVDVSGVASVADAATGVATITVDGRGENSIVVAGGANFVWDVGELYSYRAWFAGAYAVLFQLEIPIEVVTVLARMAKEAGAMTILDPAPAQVLPRGLLDAVDLLTPNESEMLGIGDVQGRKVLLKHGGKGSRWGDLEVAAIDVEALDTTAAGDTYNAALAVGLSEGMDRRAAMRFASVAAGLSVTRVGAQSSAPSRDDVDGYGLSW